MGNQPSIQRLNFEDIQDTIKNNNKIIQGFSSLKESSLAINYVLRR